MEKKKSVLVKILSLLAPALIFASVALYAHCTTQSDEQGDENALIVVFFGLLSLACFGAFIREVFDGVSKKKKIEH